MKRERICLTSHVGAACLFDGYQRESVQPSSGGASRRVVHWRGTGVLIDGEKQLPFLFVTEPEDATISHSLEHAVLMIKDERGNRRNPLFVFNRHELESEVINGVRQLLRSRKAEELPTIQLLPLSATRLMLNGSISMIDHTA